MKQSRNFKDWIVFENENYLVINKPPYLATLEDRSSPLSILKLAREYFSSVQVCHRLDKETSGVLLLAKSPAAYKNASSQFSDRQVKKTYHAVTNGIHDLSNEVIDFDLSISASGLVKVKKGAKPSITIVTTLEKYRHHTLVECLPETGRMHQIRVHLAAVGAPLIADATYGGKDLLLSHIKKGYRPKPDEVERPLMARVALHAQALEFRDLNNEIIKISGSYPKDFQTVITQLRKFS
jgi:23S rRNA pseudouridine955/2504/2580 synthase